MEMLIDDGTMTVEAHGPLVWFLHREEGCREKVRCKVEISLAVSNRVPPKL
jgi:hypothetical protein